MAPKKRNPFTETDGGEKTSGNLPTRRRSVNNSPEPRRRAFNDPLNVLDIGFIDYDTVSGMLGLEEAEHLSIDFAFIELALKGRDHGHDFRVTSIIKHCYQCHGGLSLGGYYCSKCYKAYHKFCIEKVDDPCPNRVNTLKFVPPARDRTRRANNSRELSKEQKNRLRKIRCIEVCMEHIIKKGAKVEGIYRKSGSAARIKSLFGEVRNGRDLEKLLEDEARVHDITGLFKKILLQSQELFFSHYVIGRLLAIIGYYSHLLERLPPEEAGNNLNISIVVIPDSLPAPVQKDIALCLQELPDLNLYILRKFFKHLKLLTKSTKHNKMTSWNLSLIFASVLFKNYVVVSSRRFLKAHKTWCATISILIEHYEDLFGTKRKLNALFPKAAVDLTFPSTEDEETFVEDFDENEHHDDVPISGEAEENGKQGEEGVEED